MHRFRAYHIDISTTSVQYLTTVTRRQYCIDFDATGDILATVIEENNTYLVALRKLPFSAGAIQEEAVLNLGPNLLTSCTNILCHHMILVSTSSSLRLYQIPEFLPVRSNIEHSNLATPLATHVIGKPNPDKLIWNALCAHLDHRICTYIFSDEEEALLILPLPGQSGDDIVCHVFEGPCFMGSSRAIGCRKAFSTCPMEIQCFAPCSRKDSHIGYVRLGRTQAPNPSRPVSVQLPGYDGRVEDLSWDEESGRICLIYKHLGDSSARSLLMIGMI